jgi:hypothetical protein
MTHRSVSSAPSPAFGNCREKLGSSTRFAVGATRSRLICHSLAAAAVSWEAGLEAFGLRPAKYVPVTPSTSGEEAR